MDGESYVPDEVVKEDLNYLDFADPHLIDSARCSRTACGKPLGSEVFVREKYEYCSEECFLEDLPTTEEG